MSDVKLKCGCWAHVDCCDYVSRRIVENEEAQAVLRSDLAAAIARAERAEAERDETRAALLLSRFTALEALSVPVCRHCGETGHDDTGRKPGPLCRRHATRSVPVLPTTPEGDTAALVRLILAGRRMSDYVYSRGQRDPGADDKPGLRRMREEWDAALAALCDRPPRPDTATLWALVERMRDAVAPRFLHLEGADPLRALIDELEAALGERPQEPSTVERGMAIAEAWRDGVCGRDATSCMEHAELSTSHGPRCPKWSGHPPVEPSVPVSALQKLAKTLRDQAAWGDAGHHRASRVAGVAAGRIEDMIAEAEKGARDSTKGGDVSDHVERACTFCGSYLHHEDDCERRREEVMDAAEGVSTPSGFGTPLDDTTMRRPYDCERIRATCGTCGCHEGHWRHNGAPCPESPEVRLTVVTSERDTAIARAEHLCVVANDLSARHTLALKWRQEYDALRASLAALVEDMQEKVDHSHYTQNTRAIYYMAARSIEVALERSRDDED